MAYYCHIVELLMCFNEVAADLEAILLLSLYVLFCFCFKCFSVTFPPLLEYARSLAIALRPSGLHPIGRLLNREDNTWLTCPSVPLLPQDSFVYIMVIACQLLNHKSGLLFIFFLQQFYTMKKWMIPENRKEIFSTHKEIFQLKRI
jgi:hypothetical protein